MAAASFTGDMRNNLTKLLREIKRMKLKIEPNLPSLCLGSPSAFLPVLHSALMHFSLPLANWLTRNDFSLSGKNDLRFLEALYKVLRDVFHYRPKLTREQFLSAGFAERKVQLATDVLLLCQAKHRELSTRKTRKVANRLHTDVLSVRDTSGIGSAWAEHNTHTQVQGSAQLYTPPPSPDQLNHTPPPSPDQLSHTLSSPHRVLTQPSKDLDLTPRPLNLCPGLSHSSPKQSNPQLITRGEPSTSTSTLGHQPATSDLLHQHTVIKHHTEQNARMTISTDMLPHKNDAHTSVEANPHKSASGRDSPESWQSLPQERMYALPQERIYTLPQERMLHTLPQESVPQDQKLQEAKLSQSTLDDLSAKVQQLTKLVETMSARSVLLETQVKLLEAQSVRTMAASQRTVSRAVQTETPPLARPDKATQIGNTAANCMRAHEGTLEGRTSSIAPTRSLHSTDVSTARVPFTETPVGNKSGWKTSLREKLLLSSSQSWKQQHGGDDIMMMSPAPTLPTTPHTPEDTRRIIEQLRGRAKMTKDFLHLANHTDS